MTNCIVCGTTIPEGRLKAIPGTKRCVQHSDATRFVGNLVSTGNAEAGELHQEFEVIRDPKQADTLHNYSKLQGRYS